MNILFIEDEPDLLEMSAARLQRGQHCVFPAANIAEARAILEDGSKHVDIMISDHRLPDGLGAEFAVEVQKAYPSVKCAIISGSLAFAEKAEIQSLGLLFFQKPLLYGKVVDSIRKHYALRAPVAKTLEEKVNEETLPGTIEKQVSPLVVEKKKFWSFGRGKAPRKPPGDS